MAGIQRKIEHHRTRSREPIQVGLKTVVQDNIASFNPKSPLISSFFITA
jgi:hypothetical protein